MVGALTDTPAITIGVVLGSSRGQRLGERVARFVLQRSAEVPGAGFALFDLAGYHLPFFDEVTGAARRAPGVVRWLEDMASADGYLFVVPEYNYAVPALVKNSLDFLVGEADGKPASVLSYSTTSHGGTIAGHLLPLTLNKVGMLPLPRSVALAHADQLLRPDGTVDAGSVAGAEAARSVSASLAELARYSVALRPLRHERAD